MAREGLSLRHRRGSHQALRSCGNAQHRSPEGGGTVRTVAVTYLAVHLACIIAFAVIVALDERTNRRNRAFDLELAQLLEGTPA